MDSSYEAIFSNEAYFKNYDRFVESVPKLASVLSWLIVSDESSVKYLIQ